MIFALRHLLEKHLVKSLEVHMAFINLKKTYGRVFKQKKMVMHKGEERAGKLCVNYTRYVWGS